MPDGMRPGTIWGGKRDEGGGMRDEEKKIALISSLIPPPSSLLFYSPQLAPIVFLMMEGCLCPSSWAWMVVL